MVPSGLNFDPYLPGSDLLNNLYLHNFPNLAKSSMPSLRGTAGGVMWYISNQIDWICVVMYVFIIFYIQQCSWPVCFSKLWSPKTIWLVNLVRFYNVARTGIPQFLPPCSDKPQWFICQYLPQAASHFNIWLLKLPFLVEDNPFRSFQVPLTPWDGSHLRITIPYYPCISPHETYQTAFFSVG